MLTLERVLTKIHLTVLAGALFVLNGCSNYSLKENDVMAALAPVNMIAGYFGAVGTHEGAHALTAKLYGAESVQVSVIPEHDNSGAFYLGTTDYSKYGHISDMESTLFNISGPASMFAGHAVARETLKTNNVPHILQPTLQWYALSNKVGYYYHTISGLARDKNSDLGKEEAWISATFLFAGIAYDAYDILSDDIGRYFGVLGGQKFYEPENSNIKPVFHSDGKSAFFGIKFEW